MTTDVVPVKSGGTADFVSTSLRHGFAGAICGVLTIAYSLSYAALVFSGPIAQWLSYGIAVTFLSAAVGGAVIALRSSLPFAVAGPDSTNSAVIAVLVGALVQRLLTDHPTEDILPPVLILMAIGTALTGALLLGLGLARAGAAIRFLPYPVVGGFLGATGWLLVTGAMHVSTGQPVALSTIALLLDVSSLPKIAAALAVAIVLFAGRRALRSPLALPALLIASIAAFHLVLVLLDTSVEEARAAGWTFWPEPVPGLALPWHADALLNFPWAALPSLSGDLLAVMFVSVVTMLLNTTGTEFATRREADLDHELKVHGIANLLTAALGGFISSISVSRSTLNYLAGARERGAGLVAAAIPAAMIGLDPAFLGFLPKCAFGGLLFFVGLDLIYRWIFDSWRRLAPIEYLSLLAIASIIIGWGYVAGMVVGMIIGCATFALSASRINAIKFSFDGSEYHSSLDRASHELAILAAHGRELQGICLQSYLFFGSANRLYQHVKRLLASKPECRFLLFDFRLVTGVDSSATYSFMQIKQAADDNSTQLVLACTTADIQNALRDVQFIAENVHVAPDLDRALEVCENAIIKAHEVAPDAARTLRQWLTDVLGDVAHADILARYCRRLEIAAGEVVARQGEPAQSMHFLLSGRVSVIVRPHDGGQLRVRSLGPQTTIGEMGLICARPRAATIKAESASVVYVLDTDAFGRIKTEHPALFQALLTYVINVMADRLSFANRAIGILQR